jgi:hypothetical protein
MNEKVDREVAAAKLAELDRRRSQIELELAPLDERSYKRQELAHELRHLDGERAETVRLMTPARFEAQDQHRRELAAQAKKMRERHEPTNTHPEVVAARKVKRKEIINRLEIEERKSIEATAERFEREGDHRNARLWRESIWSIRERLEA